MIIRIDNISESLFKQKLELTIKSIKLKISLNLIAKYKIMFRTAIKKATDKVAQ